MPGRRARGGQLGGQLDVFLAHLIRPTTRYRCDIQALRAVPPRIVIAVGTLAGQLETPVVEFPGDHGGFAALPQQFGRVLDRVLTETP